MKRALLFLLLAGCSSEAEIRAERITREARTERNVLATDSRMLWTRPADPPRLPDECEPGDVGSCMGTIRKIPRGERRACPCAQCMAMVDGSRRWNRAQCNTPLVVSFDDAPVEFTQADAAFTVGVSARTEWVSAKTPWVALDRDGSGCIESARELFAGFDALAELDANGDGVVDARDPAFAELVMWSDRNQDKRCTPDEIAPLSSRVRALPLAHASRADAPMTSYEGDTATIANGVRLVDVHLAPFD